MSADWSEMRFLEGRQFLADTSDPSRSWLERYLPPEDRSVVVVAIREAVDHKSPFELEHRVIRPDGDLGWTHSRAVPLLDDRGEIVEWFGAGNDITGRKRTEEALHMSEARLRAALREAEEASRAKDHFLAVLSHELRTPLMPITMALAVLDRRPDVPEAVRQTHEMIRRSVDLKRVSSTTIST